MEKDVVKVLLATVTAITILNILTHGKETAGIAAAVGKVWVSVLQVLSGQRPAAF